MKRTAWARQIHVVLDTLSAHKTKDVERFLREHPRVRFHFTADIFVMAQPGGVMVRQDPARRDCTSLTLPNGVVAAYGYDAASRLTSITYTQGINTVGNLTYTYDANGRSVQMGGSLAHVNLPAALSSATYNANNQLTQWGATTLTYDLDGNLTNDGTTTYTWNARNQLSAFGATSFAYDANGRRTRNASGVAFLYDSVNPVQELSGSLITANLLTGLGVDEIFTRTDVAGARNFLTDSLGSAMALTDSAGTTQTQYSYEPFGKTTSSGTANASTFQYTGRENDATGLYYYRARYYNPTVGRFISEDPLMCQAKQGLDLYVYVSDDPLDLTDPSGLLPGGVGTDGCKYYDDLCKYSKGRGGDTYACKAGNCCRDFGEGPKQDCARKCLIDLDGSCVFLSGNKPLCRVTEHVKCYAECRLIPGINGPKVPQSCLATGFGL